MMAKMRNEEMKEIFGMLEKAGMSPAWCDTLVPYIDTPVQAGIPTDHGEHTRGNYVMLPRELMGMNPEFVISVIGNSMKDVDIQEGDRLEVMMGTPIRDGDIVVASINGESTVKAYCKDEFGDCWLVPRNEAFNAIQLTEDMEVSIIGKVVGCIKQAPRTSYAELLKCIKRTRGKSREDRRPTVERIESIIREMSEVVKHGRQWYAVYRSFVDKGVLAEGEYLSFCEKVAALVHEHGHLPVAGELKRMAVQSFRKPSALWERGNAPVTGQRFDDYLRIANLTLEKLRR